MNGVLNGAETGASTGEPARTRNDPGLRGARPQFSPEERRHSRFPEPAAGLAGTLLLFQAHGDVNLGAPLWCSPRGAVSVGRSDMPGSPARDQIAVRASGVFGHRIDPAPAPVVNTALPMNSAIGSGTDPAMGFGTVSGTEPAMEPGTEPMIRPGTALAMEPGTVSGTESAMNAGTEPDGGYTLIARPGTEPGTELDLESGTEPGTGPASSFGRPAPRRAGRR